MMRGVSSAVGGGRPRPAAPSAASSAAWSARAWPPFVDRLLPEVAAERLPPRRERGTPRVVERKRATFTLTRPHHATPPKPRPITATIRLL